MGQNTPYSISQVEYTNQPSVYKLFFGTRYFIFKGKLFPGSPEQNLSDIYKLRWARQQKIDHIFYPVVEHIKRTRVLSCTVEIILQTDDVHDLVEMERKLLQVCKEDPNCLNRHFEPIIPKWIAEQLSPVSIGSGSLPVKVDPVKSSPVQKKEAPVGKIIPSTEKSKPVQPKNEPTGKFSAIMDAFDQLK